MLIYFGCIFEWHGLKNYFSILTFSYSTYCMFLGFLHFCRSHSNSIPLHCLLQFMIHIKISSHMMFSNLALYSAVSSKGEKILFRDKQLAILDI